MHKIFAMGPLGTFAGCDTGVPMSAQSAGTRESFRDSKIRFEWVSFVSVTSYKS